MDKARLIRRNKNPLVLDLQEKAAVIGKSKFLCSVPCARGHTGLRYTLTGQCVKCKSEISRKHNSAHRGEINEERRINYKDNRDEILERQRNYRKANPEKARTWRSNAYWKDPEKIRKRSRGFYHKDPEAARARSRATYQRNKESYKDRKAELAHKYYFSDVKSSRSRSRNKDYIRRGKKRRGVKWGMFRDWVQDMPKICFYCGRSCEDDCHVDHFIPLSKGGAHVLTNLRMSCRSCNLSKAARMPREIEEMLCA